jgi:hypothetical protein
MARFDCRLRRCLWDAIGVPLIFGIVILGAVACNYFLERLV